MQFVHDFNMCPTHRVDPKRSECKIPLASPCTADGVLQKTVQSINPITWAVSLATNGSLFRASDAAAYNQSRSVSLL